MLSIESCEFFKKLKLFSEIETIILYGSRARNTHRQRSDIDLAIVCPAATEDLWVSMLDTVKNNNDTLLKIDCVRYDTLTEDNPLKKAIDKEGKVIFQRENQ